MLMLAKIILTQVMINSNPQLRAMADANPQLRATLGNPDMMRQMLDPQNMQAMARMQQASAL